MFFRNSINYSLILINSFFILLLYTAYLMGWANRVFESDSSYIIYVIAVIFLVLWVFSLFIGSWVNKQLNDLILNEGSQIYDEYSSLLKKRFELPKNQNFDHSILASTLQVKLNLKIKIISYVANLLILLGLIGTVIGFIIAVGGLGDSLVGGQNLARVQTVLGQIVNGMGVALFTTLMGSIFGGIWLQLHYEILSSAIDRLVVLVIEQAESELISSIIKNK